MDRNMSSMMNFNEEKEPDLELAEAAKNQLKITLIKNGMRND